MPIFILVGKLVLLVCMKSVLIMLLPARTINKTPLNNDQSLTNTILLFHAVTRAFLKGATNFSFNKSVNSEGSYDHLKQQNFNPMTFIIS